MRSYLYVLSNSAMPCMVKLSCSEEHPSTVLRYLDTTGACPFGFTLEYHVILNDCFPILQSVRRILWANLRNLSHGWYSIKAEEAVNNIRHEIASFILNKFRHEIERGYADDNFSTILRMINSVLFFADDSPLSRKNDLAEAREVSKYIVMIINNEGLFKKDRRLSIVAKKNQLSFMSKHR